MNSLQRKYCIEKLRKIAEKHKAKVKKPPIFKRVSLSVLLNPKSKIVINPDYKSGCYMGSAFNIIMLESEKLEYESYKKALKAFDAESHCRDIKIQAINADLEKAIDNIMLSNDALHVISTFGEAIY